MMRWFAPAATALIFLWLLFIGGILWWRAYRAEDEFGQWLAALMVAAATWLVPAVGILTLPAIAYLLGPALLRFTTRWRPGGLWLDATGVKYRSPGSERSLTWSQIAAAERSPPRISGRCGRRDPADRMRYIFDLRPSPFRSMS